MTTTEKFKFIFVGDGAVGKTSLIARFVYDTFDDSYMATIGMDLIWKRIQVGNRSVRLQLWDTAGQERFRSLIPVYFRDAHVAVIMYDVANRSSFLNVEGWADEVRKEKGSDILLALIANKNDLIDKRQVSTGEGQTLSDELEAVFFETSAKNGTNVSDIFHSMTVRLLEEGVEPGTGVVGSIEPNDDANNNNENNYKCQC
eukprot:GHVR01076485.1.p1 GENE.GHVR01076485.1~~GHVR01076485.1.p1  ORF type:complete len:201 (+),score=52.24 GHVR01076485.1:71-673(+)